MITTEIRYIKGVGPQREAVLAKVGVSKVIDLLYYFPFRYEDRRNVRKIKELKENETALVQASIAARRLKKIPHFARKKVRDIFEVVLTDGTGRINCVWFNQGYLAETLTPGKKVIVFGKVAKRTHLQFVAPEFELADEDDEEPLNVGRIVSVYPLTAGLHQKFLRRSMAVVMHECPRMLHDPIPAAILQKKSLPDIAQAFRMIHMPVDWPDAQIARERFIFEELFISQILVAMRKARHQQQQGPFVKIDDEIVGSVTRNAGFPLTRGQLSAVNAIIEDFRKPYPMRRLLQGDVGCGKTIVAAYALAIAASSGFQAALMVPTEVLAYQHVETLRGLLAGLGIRIEVLVASRAKKDTERIRAGLADGSVSIAVGTHALIQGEVTFKNLGLAIIDEQHKFGVAQRALLPKKGKVAPHVLVMSATPIPRSLALSLYGDLDLSVIADMPANRLPPKNIRVSDLKRADAYALVRKELAQGRQVYVVYPLIEESGDQELKSVETMFRKLAKEFCEYKLGKFYGTLPAQEKISAIEAFRKKEIDILVATTVMEVGVSVENATVMVVENPERFGLAQLHQLRGRIQRSAHQPYFIVIDAGESCDESNRRLKAICATNDGFKIAEEDLLLRGPGDFFGSMQHGLPALKIANPVRDMEILSQARECAQEVIARDPCLSHPAHQCIRGRINIDNDTMGTQEKIACKA